MGALKDAAQEQGITASRGRSFSDMLQKQWSRIEDVMPEHMNGNRLFQIAVSTYNHDPKLAQCDSVSLLSCVMKCSALGLEPSSVDGLGRAYILPYWNSKTRSYQATFILGYRGILELARRSGEILDISARTVHIGDEFRFQFGLHEDVVHIPANDERTYENMTHVYMICRLNNGGHYIDVMTKPEVDEIRQRTSAKDREGNIYGPWVTDGPAMARKSVVKRAFPYLPISVEAQMGVSSDGTTGGFESKIASALEVKPVTVEDVNDEGDAPKDQDAAISTRRAVCRTCGNVIEGVTEDALPEDLTQDCCADPKYEIEEIKGCS